MPFTPVAAPTIDLLQNAVDGDVFIPSFSRRSFLTGASSVLSVAPALTMVGNLLTVDAPVRNYALEMFAGLGLSIETTTAAGNAPAVARRDIQSFATAATSHLYVYPGGMRIGQLLVVAVATAALTTITTPGGWTLEGSQAGTESRLSVYSRVITGVEVEEVLTFGTASGALIRSWVLDIAHGDVETLTGLNDSAAGTSLDLATISPTWATTEAHNTLYLALVALADDVAVSGFPAGYTVTGQDTNTSGTANIDCALGYAERSALGSSENPGAFTYAASRSTGMVVAIRPAVTARMNWDGLAVRKAGVLVGTRRAINLIEGTNVTLTVADNAGTGAVDVTVNSTSSGGHTLRDDGVDMTTRAAANFVTSASITAVLTDDAVNNETEITFQLGAHTGDVTSAANSLALTIANNAVTNAKAADMAANTIKANPTAGTADPQDLAIAAESIVGRTSGNLQAITSATQTALIRAAGSVFWASAAADQVLRRSGSGDLGFGTLVTGNIGDGQVTVAKMQTIAAHSMLVNITGATAAMTVRSFANMCGDGLVYDSTNGHWDVNGSTSIAVTGDQVQRAALVGAILAAQNSNDTTFGGIRVNDSIQTARGAINFFQSSTIDPAGTDDSVNNEIEIRFNIITNSVGNTLLTDMPDATIKGRQRGAGTGDPDNLTGAEVGSIVRFATTESISAAGIVTDVNIDASTTVPRWTNGGATSIVRSISAPVSEGPLMFPEITTGGGDEAIFLEDPSQTANNQIRTPGGIPFRFSSGTPMFPMLYQSQSNKWSVSGIPGGDHASVVEIDEHFDFAVQTAITLEGGSGNALFNFTSSNHSWVANAVGTGTSATVGNIDNVLHHRGILSLTCTNQTNGTCAIYIGRDVISGGLVVDESMYDSDQIWRFETWVRIPSGQTTSFEVMAGIAEDPADVNAGTEFIGFVGATNNGTSATNWVARCRAASTNTELNTAVAFSNNVWHKLEFFRFDEYVIFYVNRVMVGLISTNVPNGNITPMIRVKALSASARSFHVDRLRLHLRESAMD